jgi:hypothetical protein
LLDSYLNDKETEAREKSEKIGFIEALCRKKHELFLSSVKCNLLKAAHSRSNKSLVMEA